MSWDSNRDKQIGVRHPFRKKTMLRRMKDTLREREDIKELRWDLHEETEGISKERVGEDL